MTLIMARFFRGIGALRDAYAWRRSTAVDTAT
jgi:hypothetical protein